MQCEMRCKSRSLGLDTALGFGTLRYYGPSGLLDRRSLPYLNDIDSTFHTL